MTAVFLPSCATFLLQLTIFKSLASTCAAIHCVALNLIDSNYMACVKPITKIHAKKYYTLGNTLFFKWYSLKQTI